MKSRSTSKHSKSVSLSLLAAASLALPAWAGDAAKRWNTTSDVLTLAVPAMAAGLALSKDDQAGLQQLGLGLVTSVGAAEALKSSVHSNRPDGSDRKSFPSAQTTVVFTAARFVDKRYGDSLGGWTPWLYAGAATAGIARVEARRHHWVDVAAGAALGYGAASWWSEPVQGGQLSVVPLAGGVSVAWGRRF